MLPLPHLVPVQPSLLTNILLISRVILLILPIHRILKILRTPRIRLILQIPRTLRIHKILRTPRILLTPLIHRILRTLRIPRTLSSPAQVLTRSLRIPRILSRIRRAPSLLLMSSGKSR